MLLTPSPYNEQQILKIYMRILDNSLHGFPRFAFNHNDYVIKAITLITYAKKTFGATTNDVTSAWLRKHKLGIIARLLKGNLYKFLMYHFEDFDLRLYKGKINTLNQNIFKRKIEHFLEVNRFPVEFLYNCDRNFFDRYGTVEFATSDEVFFFVSKIFNLKKYAFKKAVTRWNKQCLREETLSLMTSLNKDIYSLSIYDLKQYRLDEAVSSLYNNDYSKFLNNVKKNTYFYQTKINQELFNIRIKLCGNILENIKENTSIAYLRELRRDLLDQSQLTVIDNSFNGIRDFKSFALEHFKDLPIGKYGNIKKI